MSEPVPSIASLTNGAIELLGLDAVSIWLSDALDDDDEEIDGRLLGDDSVFVGIYKPSVLSTPANDDDYDLPDIWDTGRAVIARYRRVNGNTDGIIFAGMNDGMNDGINGIVNGIMEVGINGNMDVGTNGAINGIDDDMEISRDTEGAKIVDLLVLPWSRRGRVAKERLMVGDVFAPVLGISDWRLVRFVQSFHEDDSGRELGLQEIWQQVESVLEEKEEVRIGN